MKKNFVKFVKVAVIFFLLICGAGTTFAQSAGSGSSGITVSQPPLIPTGTTGASNNGITAGGEPIVKLTLPGANMTGSDAGQALQNTLLPNITTIVVQITGGLSLLFIIISGVQLLTAYGNEEKLGEAKKTITWALGGLVISMLSYAIVQILIAIHLS